MPSQDSWWRGLPRKCFVSVGKDTCTWLFGLFGKVPVKKVFGALFFADLIVAAGIQCYVTGRCISWISSSFSCLSKVYIVISVKSSLLSWLILNALWNAQSGKLKARCRNAGVPLLCALTADGRVWLVSYVKFILQAFNYSSLFYLVRKGKEKFICWATALPGLLLLRVNVWTDLSYVTISNAPRLDPALTSRAHSAAEMITNGAGEAGLRQPCTSHGIATVHSTIIWVEFVVANFF